MNQESESKPAQIQERATESKRAAASGEPLRTADDLGAAGATPQAWLDAIIKLRSEGRIVEAKERLAAFKQRYPEHPLPSLLKDL